MLTHSVHSGLSIVCPLKIDREESVRSILRGLTAGSSKFDSFPIDQMPSLLCASGVVIDGEPRGNEDLPSLVMFFTSFSGPLQKHLKELVEHAHPALYSIFQHTEVFPANTSTDKRAMIKFLKKNNHPSTFFSGMHGISRLDIDREEQLRKAIRGFLNETDLGELRSLDSFAIQKKIQDHITADRRFSWAKQACNRTFADWLRMNRWFAAIAVGIVVFLLGGGYISWLTGGTFQAGLRIAAIVLGVLLLLVAITAFFAIRHIESGEHLPAERMEDEEARRRAETQNHPITNEMSVVGKVKMGAWRRAIFVAVLRVVATATPNILIPTVATARWLSVNKGKRIVFISNYSNTADSYVRDFIDSTESAKGVNLLFGHGEGYPKTRYLINDGALADPEAFMNVFRSNQHFTDFWFWPAPSQSIDNIRLNRKIRNGLYQSMSKKNTTKWLNRL